MSDKFWRDYTFYISTLWCIFLNPECAIVQKGYKTHKATKNCICKFRIESILNVCQGIYNELCDNLQLQLLYYLEKTAKAHEHQNFELFLILKKLQAHLI